jgi:hypothetical protein
MRIVAVYKDYSDHAREMNEWLDQFERRSGQVIDRIDPESLDGETFCTARDIVLYPTIAVVGDDGKTYEMWSGSPLPVIDEVMGYIAR